MVSFIGSQLENNLTDLNDFGAQRTPKAACQLDGTESHGFTVPEYYRLIMTTTCRVDAGWTPSITWVVKATEVRTICPLHNVCLPYVCSLTLIVLFGLC